MTTKKHRMKGLLALSATALIASTSVAIPSSAMPAPAGIREGRNVAVFHNLDFVAAFGYTLGSEMTVEVFRNGVSIGTATGNTVDAEGDGAGAMEVNHGPEGAPQPGDCWTGTTPDILPGDRVVVTADGGRDAILVDNIKFTTGPFLNKASANRTDIFIEGRASFADGRPIPIKQLDSGELRKPTPRFRANPNKVIRIPGTKNGFRAIYKAPYKHFQMPEPLSIRQQKRAILTGDHAMGYGHVDPLPAETQLVEGLGGGGPALGCEDSPAARWAITKSSPKKVKLANLREGLTISGVSHDASSILVKLNDRNPATAPLTATAQPSSASGAQTWKVTFRPGAKPGVRGVSDLSNGTLRARARYTLEGGTIGGENLRIGKNTRR
ncbi:MAG: hypothetical protein ACRDJ5_02810 [Actinomycetota bacterium]